jgi:long-chain acyl-CoA synthetase
VVDGGHHLARLAERARERTDPDHLGLYFEGRWYAAGELFDRATRLAGGFRRLGVEPGDRVVVVAANAPDVGITYQALWRCGAVATPVLFLLPPQELRHVLVDSEARAVVTTPEFLPAVQQARAGLDVAVIVAGGSGPGGTDGADRGDGSNGAVIDLEELAASEPAGMTDRADDDLAALLYTGGTTGRSKGVMLSHEALWHAGRIGYEATADDHLTRTLVPLPLSHSFGLLVTVTGQHAPDPSTAVLLRWFEPQLALDAVAEHRLEQATLVPAMLRLLLTFPLEDHDLASLQRVVCGSAPLPPEVVRAFEERVPSVTICEGYGLTETAAAATVNRRHDRRVGSVGQPLPDVELRIAPDAARDQARDPGVPPPVAPGTPGEVLVRSPSNASGYWRSPDETAATFLPDGWVRTGDIGMLGPDGHLTILDRAKDLIIRNGFNVYPRDVEDALAEHPHVAAAAVVGRPDDEVGEEVVAFVQATAGVDLDTDALRSWARDRLGPKSYPRDVRVLDAIPLTPVMKIDRKAVRGLL